MRLSLHYNGANSYLFVNGTEIYKFKATDSKIVASPLCLGNISKDWSISFKNDCKPRPEIINVNSNDPIFYPLSIKTKKCSVIVIIIMIHMQEFVLLIL